jgi:hypothetical protein
MNKITFLCSSPSCRYESASYNNDISLCKKEKTESQKFECFSTFSYFSNDLEPCYEIKKIASFKDRYNECVYAVALNNRNKDFCNEVDSSAPLMTKTPGITNVIEECKVLITNSMPRLRNQDRLH